MRVFLLSIKKVGTMDKITWHYIAAYKPYLALFWHSGTTLYQFINVAAIALYEQIKEGY